MIEQSWWEWFLGKPGREITPTKEYPDKPKEEKENKMPSRNINIDDIIGLSVYKRDNYARISTELYTTNTKNPGPEDMFMVAGWDHSIAEMRRFASLLNKIILAAEVLQSQLEKNNVFGMVDDSDNAGANGTVGGVEKQKRLCERLRRRRNNGGKPDNK